MWNLRSAVYRSIFSQRRLEALRVSKSALRTADGQIEDLGAAPVVFILPDFTRIMHVFVEACGRSHATAFFIRFPANTSKEG